MDDSARSSFACRFAETYELMLAWNVWLLCVFWNVIEIFCV